MRFILTTLTLVFLVALSDADCADRMESDFAIHRITAKDGGLYSWLHSGLLFFHDYGRDKSGHYLYCGRDGYLVEVTSLPKFSTMIREEVVGPQSIVRFLEEMFPRVFFSFMGPSHAFVIEKVYLDNRKSLPSYAWRDVTQAEIDHSFEILKKYEYTAPTIENGKWRIEFSASLHDGSVEKWTMDGKVEPFSVDHFTKAVVEKARTVIPMPEVGG